jgi:hypothetical protein
MAEIVPTSYLYAQMLLACLCSELEANAAEDPTLPAPQRCCLRAGAEVPHDVLSDGTDMCCLGEAYVKVGGLYPSVQNFPEPDAAFIRGDCQLTQFGIPLELGVLRCLPAEPDCVDSAFAVRQVAADAEAAYRAVCCWGKQLDAMRPSRLWFAGAWENFGPDGQCIGGSMPVFASKRGASCC